MADRKHSKKDDTKDDKSKQDEDKNHAERDESGNDESTDDNRSNGVPLGRMLRSTVKQFAALVGHRIEGVTSASKQEDGWRVTVEVLELERIPNTTDVLASYEVQLDRDGEIVGYARVQRYTRAQTEEG